MPKDLAVNSYYYKIGQDGQDPYYFTKKSALIPNRFFNLAIWFLDKERSPLRNLETLLYIVRNVEINIRIRVYIEENWTKKA